MKKLLIISLLISLTITTSVYSRQHDVKLLDEKKTYAEAEEAVDWEQLMREQEGAIAANDALMEYYCDGAIVPIYPAYFAGRYIQDNMLHVCYVGELKQVQEELDPVFGELGVYVIYEKRSYSYNYLKEYMDTVLINFEAQGCQITGYGISEKYNKISIDIDEDTYQNVEKMFNNVRQVNDDRIMIEKSGKNEFNATVRGGGQIAVLNSGYTLYATLGICGTYNGRPAFLTCGHDMSGAGAVYYEDTIMGTIQYVQCANTENGDFAIGYITNTTDMHPMHRLKSGTLLEGTISNPAEGTIVNRYGYATNWSYGTIDETNRGFRISPYIYIYGLVTVEPADGYTTLPGDSGGPYWCNNRFLGTHTGLNNDNGRWYFSPYSWAEAAGFTAYASHQLSSWESYNSSQHRAYCDLCQAYIYEDHAGYINAMGVCRRCGYSGPMAAD